MSEFMGEKFMINEQYMKKLSCEFFTDIDMQTKKMLEEQLKIITKEMENEYDKNYLSLMHPEKQAIVNPYLVRESIIKARIEKYKAILNKEELEESDASSIDEDYLEKNWL